jgi:hypothetical protein
MWLEPELADPMIGCNSGRGRRPDPKNPCRVFDLRELPREKAHLEGQPEAPGSPELSLGLRLSRGGGRSGIRHDPPRLDGGTMPLRRRYVTMFP